jgi:hypothetical protein
MRLFAAFFALLLLTECTGRIADPAVVPARRTDGDWVEFYSHTSVTGLLVYYYDRSRVRQHGNLLRARWKIIGQTGTVTLYDIEIRCHENTFTERGTTQIDSSGLSSETPRAELFVNRPIDANTSGDRFRQMFCH